MSQIIIVYFVLGIIFALIMHPIDYKRTIEFIFIAISWLPLFIILIIFAIILFSILLFDFIKEKL